MKKIFKLLLIFGCVRYLVFVTTPIKIIINPVDTDLLKPVSIEVSRSAEIQRDIKTNADRTYTYLIEKGLKNEQVCAIMGNIAQESDFDTSLEEYGNKIGFGLIQWSFERRQELFNYCSNPYDIYQQLDFLLLELDTQWTGNYKDIFYSSNNVDELTDAFCWGFERPSVKYANIKYRKEMANYYLELYK